MGSAVVVIQHLLLGELIINIEHPNYRQLIGMLLIGGGEKQLRKCSLWIVAPHRKLASDNFLFLGVFLLRKGGIHHGIGENFQGGANAIAGKIDPENSAIKRSVGIDIAADILNFLCDLVGRARACALKKHVLQNVGETGAQVLIFMNAAGGAPGLDARDWCAAIFLHNNR